MLSLLFGSKRETRDGNWHVVSGGAGVRVKTQAGTYVDEALALTYSAVWCATRFITETTAGLPFFTYRKKDNDDREFASDYYLYDVLKNRPNPDMGSMAFRLGRTENQVNAGNGFAEIERNPKKQVVNLWPIHAGRVQKIDQWNNPQAYELGFRYAVRNNNGTAEAMKPEEMLHIPGVLTSDGIWGKGVIAYARESIGLGLATERHGATFFGGGAQPRAVIEGLNYKDKEQRRMFRSEWKEVHGSPDSGEIAIVPPPGKYTPISLSNEDSQFLETRKHNVTEIARWYRVPPHMLMDLERATFSNIEHLSIEAVIYGLMPWLRLWEEQCNLKLIRPEDRGEYFVEHQIAGLLRGDMKSRMDSYVLALNNGVMTVNEVRRLENLNGIGEAGDQHAIQLNMTTLERMLQAPDPNAVSVPVEAEIDTELEDAAEGEPAAQLLDVPDVRQLYEYDCGAAATAAVCEFFGVTEEYAAVIEALGTNDEVGTETHMIVDYLAEQGLIVTSGEGMSVDNLRTFFENGQPVIVPLQMYGPEGYGDEPRENDYGHYVVVIGVGLGQVFYHDPAAGRGMMDAVEFDKRWHSIGDDGEQVEVRYGIAVGDEVMGKPEPKKEPEPKEPDEPDTVVDDDEPDDKPIKAAAQLVLRDTLSRMFTKESNAAARVIESKGDFDQWMTDFYGKHKSTLAEALAPACAALVAAGVVHGDMAPQLIEASKTDLSHAYNSLSKEKFLAYLRTWPTARAETWAGQLMGEPCESRT